MYVVSVYIKCGKNRKLADGGKMLCGSCDSEYRCLELERRVRDLESTVRQRDEHIRHLQRQLHNEEYRWAKGMDARDSIIQTRDKALDMLNTQYKITSAELKDALRLNQANAAKHTAVIKELLGQHEIDLADLRHRHEEHIKQKDRDHQMAVNVETYAALEALSSFQEEMAATLTNCRKQLADKENKHAAIVHSLTMQHEQTLATQQLLHEEELYNLRISHEEELADLQISHEEELSNLRISQAADSNEEPEQTTTQTKN